MEKLEIINVEALINVPVEQAWAVWNNPTHIKNWYFASDDWCAPNAENDLRTGGKFITRMEAKDGSFGFDFNGIYSKVIENELIEYNIEGGRTVSILFTNKGDTTLIVEKFEAETENPIELQKAGWQAILDNYKKYAESI